MPIYLLLRSPSIKKIHNINRQADFKFRDLPVSTSLELRLKARPSLLAEMPGSHQTEEYRQITQEHWKRPEEELGETNTTAHTA